MDCRRRMQAPARDLHFVECADAEDGAAKIPLIVRERIPERYGLDPIRDIQVLCPTNRGDRSISICSRRFAGRAARRAVRLDLRHRRQG